MARVSMKLHKIDMIKTYTCLASALVEVVLLWVLDFDVVILLVTWGVEVLEDVFEVVGDAVPAPRLAFVAVTTIGNLAEQKLAASGTPARGFNRP